MTDQPLDLPPPPKPPPQPTYPAADPAPVLFGSYVIHDNGVPDGGPSCYSDGTLAGVERIRRTIDGM